MSDPSKDWDRHYDLFHPDNQAPVIPVPQDILDQVEANADSSWLYGAEAAIRYLAANGARFTGADVLKLLEEWNLKTHENRALGAIIRKMAKRGVIEATSDWRPTGSHGRLQKVWRKYGPVLAEDDKEARDLNRVEWDAQGCS